MTNTNTEETTHTNDVDTRGTVGVYLDEAMEAVIPALIQHLDSYHENTGRWIVKLTFADPLVGAGQTESTATELQYQPGHYLVTTIHIVEYET